jgi:phosphatidylserine/phosphatidylglycerophosphate/cardiolipin synthase-like enzyme
VTRTSLTSAGTATLSRLRDAIASKQLHTPLSETGLLAFGVRDQAPALYAALAGHGQAACLAILDVALAERAKRTRPEPELVWTGPENHSATARDTAVVLEQLFEGATKQVILAGYSFDHGHALLAPLHRAMRDRGVSATFFVHVEQAKTLRTPPEAHAHDALADFLAKQWPFGPPYPRIYYDKRALTPGWPYVSLHAKCVVVDDDRAFISSANFTDRGHERNIETGVLLHDPLFAASLARQWLGLISAQHVGEWRP